MKKILSLIFALTLLLGTVLTLASCGAPKDDGAQISVYLGDPIYDFDPTDYYTDSNAEQLMGLLYEPLFTLNENGEIKYAAANKYSVDKEKREITINLRESYWSDGARVTADDFLYSWRDHLLEPTKANPAAALLYDIEGAMEVKQGKLSNSELAIEANLYELKITYREGGDYNQLLKNLASIACAPIRQGAVTAAPSYWSKNANSIVTNGPFIVSTLSYPDGELTLERNIGYRQPKDSKDYDNNVVPHKLVTFFTVDGYTVDCSYKDIEEKIGKIYVLQGNKPIEVKELHAGDIGALAKLSGARTEVFSEGNKLAAWYYGYGKGETESQVFCKTVVDSRTVFPDRHIELRLNHLSHIFHFT